MTEHLQWPGLRSLAKMGCVLALAATITACSGMSSRETTNTAIGAGLGGLGGAVLSGGDGWATAGGAVAGGVLGNILTDDDDDRYDRRDRRDRDNRRYRR